MWGLGDGSRAEALELARSAWRRTTASVRRTPGLLLISFLLGVSIWVFVTDTENPTVIEYFPQPVQVEAVNVGETLAVANQLPSVRIRVSAPTDRWEELSAANFRAFVNLQGFDARAQDVQIQVEVVGIGGVRVVDTDPGTTTVNLEDLVSKAIPVDTRVVGSLPIGYELGSMTPEQSEVTVTGPESLVALVSEAAADVNVTGLTVGFEQTVPLKPLTASGSEIRGVRIEPAATRVTLQVTQSTIVRTVPLTVRVTGTPAEGFRVTGVATTPSAVQIQGPIESLQQVDSIALPAVNVNGARSEIVRSVAIPLPPGLSFVDTERATVTVTIAEITSTLRIAMAVDVLGLTPGSDTTLEPGNVTVVVEGPLPVLNALASGDIRATIDVSDRGPGVYSVPVTVTVPDGVEIVSMQPEEVTVTIR